MFDRDRLHVIMSSPRNKMLRELSYLLVFEDVLLHDRERQESGQDFIKPTTLELLGGNSVQLQNVDYDTNAISAKS